MALGMQRFISSPWTAPGLYRKVFEELRQYVRPELNANSSTTSPVQEEESSQGGEADPPRITDPQPLFQVC